MTIEDISEMFSIIYRYDIIRLNITSLNFYNINMSARHRKHKYNIFVNIHNKISLYFIVYSQSRICVERERERERERPWPSTDPHWRAYVIYEPTFHNYKWIKQHKAGSPDKRPHSERYGCRTPAISEGLGILLCGVNLYAWGRFRRSPGGRSAAIMRLEGTWHCWTNALKVFVCCDGFCGRLERLFSRDAVDTLDMRSVKRFTNQHNLPPKPKVSPHCSRII